MSSPLLLSDISSKYLSNNINYPDSSYYAAIIGKNPSQGARSPFLWNKVFETLNLDIQMLPFDVCPEKVDDLLQALSSSPLFIGGCVAVPHKEAIAKIMCQYIDSPQAQSIGAVNALYRQQSGQLSATNTDGEAASLSLVNSYGSISGKKVLILGAGGAGKAVCSYVSSAVGENGRVFLANRTQKLSRDELDNIGANEFIHWPRISQTIPKVDIVINCTTVGSTAYPNETPLSSNDLALNKSLFVYDIIYQPEQTLLLTIADEYGLRRLGGLDMNLRQAVLACTYATQYIKPSIQSHQVHSIMIKS